MNQLSVKYIFLNEIGQLDHLFSRKLLIPDRQRAPHYLRFIGYYRLSDYALFFPEQNSRNLNSNAGSDWLSCLPKPNHIPANAMA